MESCVLLLIASLLAGVDYARAARVEALIYDEFDNCDDSDRPARLIKPRIVTLRPGVTVGRADANLTTDATLTQVIVDTHVCDLNNKRANCRKFLNWKREGDVCSLALKKGMIWSPLFATEPPLHCPVLKKGIYHLENGTLDLAKIGMFSVPLNKYLQVRIDVGDTRTSSFLCVLFGASHKVIKT